MKPLKILISIFAILLVLTACQGEPTAIEATEPTQAPTEMPAPTDTPIPTAIPTEEVTEAPAEIPVVELVPQDAIINISWQWSEWVQTDPPAQAVVPDAENYTLTFLADNTLQIKADCNLGSGTYTIDGVNITISLGALTRAACGPDSLSETFLGFLGQAASFGMQDGKLILNLAENAGQMGFLNGGVVEAPPPEQPIDTVCDAGIDPEAVTLDPLTLSEETFVNCVASTPYDNTQPSGLQGLPDHLEITFSNVDPGQRQYGEPVIYIIPVLEYQQLWEENGDISFTETYTQLVSLLQARPDPIPTEGMPVLPFEEVTGTNDLVTQYAYVDTEAGFGVRFVGRFSQSVAPVTNDAPQLFYIFQGLSDDGLYLISFFYPVRTDALPDSGAVSDDELQQSQDDPRGYLDAKAAELNELTFADWDPSLSELDAVITSLTIPRLFEGPGLTDALWAWNELIEPDGTSLINNPDNYTLRFLPDGTLNITADCNTGQGTYTADRQFITIQLGAMTTAACGDNSLDQQFLQYLTQVESFELQPAYLALNLAEEAGTLGFYIGSPIGANPDFPADAAIAEALDTINVRSGPGVDYPSYGLASPGDQALILGVSADGAWWVIELPTYVAPDGRGWVSADYVTATNAEGVPVIDAPPLP